MASREPFVVLDHWGGGLNDTDPPLSLAEGQVTTATNVDWYQASAARKRHGCSTAPLSSYAGTGAVAALIRHTPSADETAAELWAAPETAVSSLYRLSGGTIWSAYALPDVSASIDAHRVTGTSFNGKLFLAYDTSVDRLHVWNGTSIRRVGLAQPVAPTVANTGSGSYTTTLRYYQVAYIEKVGSDIIRRSERSASTSFTPSGSGSAALVTRPALLGEGETHWELYGSADNANFYRIATTVVATSTHSDSLTVSTYATDYTLADDVNTNLPLPAARYLLTDENRLLLAGSWRTSSYGSRLWWTPVIGTTDIGDDERYTNTTTVKNYLDIDRGDGGDITGLGGPVNGNPFLFKLSQTYKLVRTGQVNAPYLAIPLSKDVGCIRQQTIVVAEDAQGNPALYWLSRRGPYRYGAQGFEYLGRVVETFWTSVNLDATVVGHGVYHEDKRQVWWWIATGVSDIPDTMLVYDVRRGGFSLFDGTMATAECSSLFAREIGSTMSLDLKPYAGYASAVLRMCDDPGQTTDDGVEFQAQIAYKPLMFAPMQSIGVTEVQVIGPSNGASLRVELIGDFGVDRREAILTLAPRGEETRVLKKVEGLDLTGAQVIQVRVGDADPTSAPWQVDGVILRYRGEDVR